MRCRFRPLVREPCINSGLPDWMTVGDVRFVGLLLRQCKLYFVILLVPIMTASACDSGFSRSMKASGQPSGSGNSSTAGSTLPGRGHSPLTVTWVSSLGPPAPPAPPSTLDWYTALVNRQCVSVMAPPGASRSLSTLVRGVRAACIAATGASPSVTKHWNIATQAYEELAGMQMPCEEGAAQNLLGRLVQAHRRDTEARISIVLPAPGQQTGCG